MGGSKAQTVGYKYPFDIHFELCWAADALLEFRGGDKTAWSGRVTTNSTINVNAPNLWGGDDQGEGGIVGPIDVMFGDEAQAPNAYLVGAFGEQSACRGAVTLVFKDVIYGSFNPYPKSAAFKLERILAAWPGGSAWYPETAEISQTYTLPPDADGWEYQILDDETDPGYDNLDAPEYGYSVGAAPFGGGVLAADGNTEWPVHTILWCRRSVSVPAGGVHKLFVRAENGCVIFVDGAYVGAVNRDNIQIPDNQDNEFEFVLGSGATHDIVIKAFDEVMPGGGCLLEVSVQVKTVAMMNPAHMLYYSKVSPTMEGAPAALLDDTHWRAQADTLYTEGFGLCTPWDPATESVEHFQERICNVIGGVLARSRRDGKWRLHLLRGDYYIDTLPVLTDDDILEWQEQPSTLDDAVNQIQVKYFDPQTKQERITPAEHALAAIEAFGGVVSQVLERPEIPTESLALRNGSRELDARSTPLSRFTPVCTRKPASWDTGTYFRLQAPRRGIADMVCLLGDIDVGTSTSSAVKLTVVQDIYRMPETSYVEPQDPIDTTPGTTPVAAPAHRLFEAPYVELAATLPNAELDALPADSGYVQAVAQRPATGVNYTLATALGSADYETHGIGDWCPTALVVEAAEPQDTAFALSDGSGLANVAVGTAALWDDEIVRVDAIDPVTGATTWGRGCADTVPVAHVAGSRVWFFDAWAATDGVEYVLGETVNAKALTRTSSEQLALDAAPTMSVMLDQRHARPYPTGQFTINGESSPPFASAVLSIGGAWRDRVLQADQLVDTTSTDVGPEAGTTATVRYYRNDVLEHTASGITAFPTTFTPASDGVVRVEVETIRDGLVSWQKHVHSFSYTGDPLEPLELEAGGVLAAESGEVIFLEPNP